MPKQFTNKPPIFDDVLTKENSPTANWLNWFNEAHRTFEAHNNLINDALVLNPDFNWSRTKGNTPTTADGEFVEKWDVISNGMTFSITPTYYTATENSSLTGSERYVNVAITAFNSSDFEIYQSIPKRIAKFQNREVTISFAANNNNNSKVQAKFYIGFDTNNDGIDEYSASSKTVFLENGFDNFFVTIKTPAIAIDNQNNTVRIMMKLINISSSVDLDLYYIKPEFSNVMTALHVDHTLEKIKIDNP